MAERLHHFGARMDYAEKQATYDAVEQALGRRRRESLEDAAKRCVRSSDGAQRRAAEVVLSGVGEPWERLRRAATMWRLSLN